MTLPAGARLLAVPRVGGLMVDWVGGSGLTPRRRCILHLLRRNQGGRTNFFGDENNKTTSAAGPPVESSGPFALDQAGDVTVARLTCRQDMGHALALRTWTAARASRMPERDSGSAAEAATVGHPCGVEADGRADGVDEVASTECRHEDISDALLDGDGRMHSAQPQIGRLIDSSFVRDDDPSAAMGAFPDIRWPTPAGVRAWATTAANKYGAPPSQENGAASSSTYGCRHALAASPKVDPSTAAKGIQAALELSTVELCTVDV
ncbi:hypothetical protein DCS_04613 [Drechmeria coniospora]|uniref:Uncharacterized protein n=1 Tax=Drechmeria coniospora TaxID=98403 RepID=A0A151GKR5_DRECN|nr:hypothetical protein DCS_04613 [Drechmeria coniospora]KYK57602.1 hypothetical protein DCS_04613 [Drechmeria coniospora]